MRTALVLCFTNLKNDARVTRQINFLKAQFKVTVVCFDAYQDPAVEFIIIKKIKLTFSRKALLSVVLLLGATRTAYKLLYGYDHHNHELRQRRFDLIVANDIETLPMAFRIGNDHSKIFFDAHEYAPRQFEDRLYWRIFFQGFIVKLCKEYIPRVHGMSTINKGLADAYETNFGITPTIITNAAHYYDLRPVTNISYPIRLVHHGIFNVSRRPELMIEMMQMLDHNKFTLDLYYLVSENASRQTKEIFEKMKLHVSKLNNVRILPPIKSSEIVETLHSGYDMGIILVPPVNFNYENGLPNKLFDCVQARLGMVVGPLKEIAGVTTSYNIGVVSHDFTARGMAAAVSDLTLSRVKEFKENTQAAAEQMNSTINEHIFLASLNAIIPAS